MKKQWLTAISAGFTVCAVALLSTTQVQAQAGTSGTSFFGNATGTGAMTVLQLSPAGDSSPYLHLFGNDFSSNGNTDAAGSINYIAGYNQNQGVAAHSFQLRDAPNGNWIRAMQIYQNGQVLIGAGRKPFNHPDYKLAVDGKLVAKSIYVTAPSNWADFVFAPGYKPMPLVELEAYLRLNKHLPALPAAKEVEEQGYSVTDMDTKLLQSMEELTLHVIELSKQNASLHRQNTMLQTRVKRMEQRMATLKGN